MNFRQLLTLVLSLCSFLGPIQGLKEVKVLENRDKRSPLDIGGRRTFDTFQNKWSNVENSDTTYLYSSDSSKTGKNNASFTAFKGNPNEYTIGGVLSGAQDVEFYFTQVLSVR